MVLVISNIDVSLIVNVDAPRRVELPFAAPQTAPFCQKCAIVSELLHSMVQAVDDDHVAIWVNCDA